MPQHHGTEQMHPPGVDVNAPEDGMRFERQWTLDKHIPVAMLLTLFAGFFMQSCVVVWWAAKVDTRIATVEQEYLMLAPVTATLVAVQTSLTDLKEDVKDIKTTLRVNGAH